MYRYNLTGGALLRIKDKIAYQNKQKPISLTSDKMVSDALEIMCNKNIGSVVIVDKKGIVEGILTERDMMHRVLYPNKNPNKTPIKEVMSAKIRCASEDDQVIDWLKVMSEERFRHLPIVDKNGKLLKGLS